MWLIHKKKSSVKIRKDSHTMGGSAEEESKVSTSTVRYLVPRNAQQFNQRSTEEINDNDYELG